MMLSLSIRHVDRVLRSLRGDDLLPIKKISVINDLEALSAFFYFTNAL
jgi:hypothetical protein